MAKSNCRNCDNIDCTCAAKFREDARFARRVLDRLPTNFGVTRESRLAELDSLIVYIRDHMSEIRAKEPKKEKV